MPLAGPWRNPGNTEMSNDLQGKHFPSAGFQLHKWYPGHFWFVLECFSEESDFNSDWEEKTWNKDSAGAENAGNSRSRMSKKGNLGVRMAGAWLGGRMNL